MKVFRICAAAVSLVARALIVSPVQTQAAFVVPDSATSTFEDWTRGDANSMYAEWNTFTSASGGTNAPDVGQFGPSVANLVNTAPGLITGTGNIYSPFGATDFDVTVPNYGYGAEMSTRVVAQLLTLTGSTPLAGNTMRLTYDNGSGDQTVYPDQIVVPGTRPEWMFVWDIPHNPASMKLDFAASGAHMSLDRFVVDTFAIPEPGTIALAGICAGLVALRRRRRLV